MNAASPATQTFSESHSLYPTTPGGEMEPTQWALLGPPATLPRRRSRLRQPPLATQTPKTVSYLWLVRQPESEPPWSPAHPMSWVAHDIHTVAEGRCDNTEVRCRHDTLWPPACCPRCSRQSWPEIGGRLRWRNMA